MTINGTDYYSTTGIYIDTTSAFNCDSIVTLDLTILPLPTGNVILQLCEGDSTTINGMDYYTITGNYADTIAGFNCDSVVTLDLTIIPFPTGSAIVQLCDGDSTTINGIDYYTATGNYVDTIAGFYCDSIVTLDLTIIPFPTGKCYSSVM